MKALLKVLSLTTIFVLSVGMVAGSENTKTESHDDYNAKFYGIIENMPENGTKGTWVVNSREIVVTDQTRIEEEYGKAEAGAYVEIEGDYVDKTFTAYKIEVKKDKKYKKKGD